MASTPGFHIAYIAQNLENAKSNTKVNSETIETTAFLGKRNFSRSTTIANFQVQKRNLNDVVRCDSSSNRGAQYQSFDGFMSRHYFNSNSSRLSNLHSPDLKRIQSCPNLSENDVNEEFEVQYELKHDCNSHSDKECEISYLSECTTEECLAEGHKSCDQQMPSRRITGLFSRSASISQAMATNGRFLSSSIIQAARPAFRYSFVNGFVGILMAFFLAAAGVLTALNSMNSTRFNGAKDCGKCSGEGAEKCKLCDGSGEIVWEGKVFHYDPCPACFGNGLVKCGHCKPRRARGLSYSPAGLGLGLGKA